MSRLVRNPRVARGAWLKSRLRLTVLVCACAASAGCSFGSSSGPPQITVTPLGMDSAPAKAAGCSMPVLYARPMVPYREVAIVEGWGGKDQGPEVLQGMRSRACQAGGDALLILSERSQTYVRKVYSVHQDDPSLHDATGDDLSNAIDPKELIPARGQMGHPGFYIDAVTIVYPKGKHPAGGH